MEKPITRKAHKSLCCYFNKNQVCIGAIPPTRITMQVIMLGNSRNRGPLLSLWFLNTSHTRSNSLQSSEENILILVHLKGNLDTQNVFQRWMQSHVLCQ